VVPAYFMLGYWFALQLVGGLPQLGGSSAGVAFWAHVGGFVAGAVLIFFVSQSQASRKTSTRRGPFGGWAARQTLGRSLPTVPTYQWHESAGSPCSRARTWSPDTKLCGVLCLLCDGRLASSLHPFARTN
jgi:hypothetical protein